MRYYKIAITDPATGKAVRTYTSLLPSGAVNPGALMVEFDIPVAPFFTPIGSAFVRVWGIPRHDISTASDLNGKTIEVYGGMSKGLPLANPAQAGLLIRGVIQQAFGNWQDTSQTLDLIITSGGGSLADVKNIVVNWKAGTTLASALAATLATAFPKLARTINISPRLVLNHDEVGYYATLVQFAQYVKTVSIDIVGAGYAGVDMVIHDGSVIAYDGTTAKTPRPIAFTDLIGQPTWIASNQIQFRTALRADLQISDYVKLPPTIVTTGASSLSQYRDKLTFQGVFMIDVIRHIGAFRTPDAESWVTTFDCHPAE